MSFYTVTKAITQLDAPISYLVINWAYGRGARLVAVHGTEEGANKHAIKLACASDSGMPPELNLNGGAFVSAEPAP